MESCGISRVMAQEKMLKETLDLHTGVYLFGAGQTGRQLAEVLIRSGIQVRAFIDEIQANLCQSILGVPVLLPDSDSIDKQIDTFVTIFNPRHEYLESASRLKEQYGFQKVHPGVCLMQKFPDECLPFYFFTQKQELDDKMNDYSDLRRVLADSLSRDFLDSYLEMIVNARFFINLMKGYNPFLILKEKLCQSKSLLLFDCGAFDGDTISAFRELFSEENLQVHAFEPDLGNYTKLLENHSLSDFDRKSKFNNLAVWSSDKTLGFSFTHSQGSCIDPMSSDQISAVSLDSYYLSSDFAMHEQTVIIKLDVEGAELEALRGAKLIIEQEEPVLVVSVYHRPHDILEIHKYLNSLNSNYVYFLRCYGGDCADLLLYAIPATKISK